MSSGHRTHRAATSPWRLQALPWEARLASLGPIVCADATAGRGFLDRKTPNADERGATRFPSFRNDCDLTEVGLVSFVWAGVVPLASGEHVRCAGFAGLLWLVRAPQCPGVPPRDLYRLWVSPSRCRGGFPCGIEGSQQGVGTHTKSRSATEVRSPGRRLRDRDSNPNFLIQRKRPVEAWKRALPAWLSQVTGPAHKSAFERGVRVSSN
jgi:hypothetical protein